MAASSLYPVCQVRNNEDDPYIAFRPDNHTLRDFHLPGKSYLAVLSEPFDFNLESDSFFAEHVKAQVNLYRQGSVRLSGKDWGIPGSDQVRMSICEADPQILDQFIMEYEEDDELNPAVKLPVNVRLFSNIQNPSEREQGSLTRLARLFGPQNLELTVKVLGLTWAWTNGEISFLPSYYDNEKDTLHFSWDEKHLCWKAKGQVTLEKAEVKYFGDNDKDPEGNFFSRPPEIAINIRDAGLANVIQRIICGSGVNLDFQKKQLSEEQFTDAVIQSIGDKEGIKCHRIKLADASPVFAKMFKEGTQWKEATSHTLELPETHEAVEALLQFIYYGGMQAIIQSVDICLELLRAGDKYQIPNLMEATLFVVQLKLKTKGWFTLDAAMQLLCFSSNLNLSGDSWDNLNKECVQFIEKSGNVSLKSSENFQNLYQIAKKLGPGFVFALGCVEEGIQVPEMFVPGPLETVSEEEAALLYDFLRFSKAGGTNPEKFGIALGMIILAEHCGKPLPEFANRTVWTYFMKKYEFYPVDFLVDLYVIAENRNARFWEEMKMGVVRKLKKYEKKYPEQLGASAKYVQVFGASILMESESNPLND